MSASQAAETPWIRQRPDWHKRYAHIAGAHGDALAAQALGLKKN